MGLMYVPVTVRPVRTARRAKNAYRARFLVDTGATDSLVSSKHLRRIGLRPEGKMRYELADGTEQEYAFGLGTIEFMGEVTAGRIIFGPPGAEPILGVTALESVGVTIDPSGRRLKRLPAVPLKRLSPR